MLVRQATRLLILSLAVSFCAPCAEDTALDQAILNDDVASVRGLLKAGVDVHAATRDEALTPLHLAAQTGDPVLIDVLLGAGASPNAVTTSGATPLMLAAAAGTSSAVTCLLQAGAEINARERKRGETALFFAVGKNRVQVITTLLARGADPNVTTTVVKLERQWVDEDGNPISDAARAGPGPRRPNVGGFARSAKATVMGGMTALHIAARDGHAAAVRALIEGGANVNQVSAGDNSSPLVIAICNGHYDVAHYLLEHGADPNLTTIDGLAALYATEDTEYAEVGWAPNPITSQENTGHLELLKLLLAHGADPNAKLRKPLWFRPTSHQEEWIDKRGVTVFWRAAMAFDVPAMKILAEAGADPKLPSDEGVTPLMAAAGLGWAANASRTVPDASLPAVGYLLAVGLDANARDNYNYTALHGAAYRGDNDVVRLLVTHGASVDVKSKRGQRAIDMANGPLVNAHLPIEHPDTIALLEKLGSPPPTAPVAGASVEKPPAVVDFELMTWPELQKAIHEEGKTTALVYNGGTEQRGPQGVTGAHTFVAHDVGIAIAQKLGNAILVPVLPYSVNKASAALPGTIGVSGPLFAELNEEVAEQLITNGFRNVVLMGDHGGGQKELAQVAGKLNGKYALQGIHVVYCDDVYAKAGADFDQWALANHLPAGKHASLKDTSELLYLEGDRPWIRKDLIGTAVGNGKENGIFGDARPSTPEIGRRIVDLKINYAVAQIRQLLHESN